MPHLRADCSRCAGLCCVALAFDQGELFAFDKPAGAACVHLDREFRCRIHPTLEAQGFSGCAHYDCLGAGQRATQEVFGGASWREHAELLRPMLEVFFQLRQVHEAIALLEQVRPWALEPEAARRLAELIEQLEPRESWSPRRLRVFCEGPVLGEVRLFLRALRPLIEAQRQHRRLSVLRPASQ